MHLDEQTVSQKQKLCISVKTELHDPKKPRCDVYTKGSAITTAAVMT